MGIAHVTILNRTQERARTLLTEFGMAGEALPLLAPLHAVELVVNSPALGMMGYAVLEPDLSGLPSEAIVYDIVNAPLETALLTVAFGRAAGRESVCQSGLKSE